MKEERNATPWYQRRERQYKLAPNPIPVSGRFLRFIALVLRKIECPILIN
jgi:hypothetical protein